MDWILRAIAMPSERNRKQIGIELAGRGAKTVVLKRGRHGALLVDRTGYPHDQAAQGEDRRYHRRRRAFTAALPFAHTEGWTLPKRPFANAAGAACCRISGRQPALPAERRSSGC